MKGCAFEGPWEYWRSRPPLAVLMTRTVRRTLWASRSGLRHLVVVLGAAAAGCGGDSGSGTAPVDNTPTAIALAPSGPLSLTSGATATLTANVTTKDGRSVAASVTWSSSDATVAPVTGGIVTGMKAGTAIISAAASGLTASTTVTVSPGAATQLAIRAQPIGGPVGALLGEQPVIEFRDQGGNLVVSSVAPVTATIASGGGTLGGPATVNAVGGVCTFSGLSIAGLAGDRTLIFTSPGLASVTSAPFTMTPPPTPVIQLDSTAVTLSTVAGTNPPAKSILVRNAGGMPFTAVTVDPAVYDTGQPTGWLTATLTGTSEPFTLTLTAATTALAVGTYHAVIRVNAPGAPNSPANLSVSLTVANAIALSYGTSAEKVKVLDPGATFSPTIAILKNGETQPASAAAYSSRATSVVTVDASGQIAAVGPGDGWVVASMDGGHADSVFVTVTRTSTGALLHADLASYLVHAGDTTTIKIALDPRASGLAAANVVVGYETENNMFTILSASIPAQSPQPIGGFSSAGVFKISIASPTALTAAVTMLTLKVTTPTANLSGWITLTVLDAVAVDGTVLTTSATSTRYPIIVR